VTARATLLGCEIDRVGISEALARCEQFIESGQFAQHVSVNASKVVSMRHDAELRNIVRRCELVTADGQSVVWASRLLGDPLPERVAGIDLMHRLIARAERNGYKVFFLGAKQGVLEQAVAHVRAEHPHLKVVGHRHGYFDESSDPAVATEIQERKPDILFVGMTTPRKEYFLGRYSSHMNVPFVMGVGGAFDVLAGVTRRAPIWMQRLGLEWLFRLAQEPRRLMRRYVVTNSRFVALVARSFVTRRRFAR
jgi:N-acetylglucosaminyldiphosphoundecaprenol N-acetyl-beta-D-mannosaminyltransferase